MFVLIFLYIFLNYCLFRFSNFQEFFLNIKDLVRRTTNTVGNTDTNLCDDYDVWRDIENNLQEKLNQTKNDVYTALCGNYLNKLIIIIKLLNLFILFYQIMLIPEPPCTILKN